ncbi:hypothetical protein PD653_1812 [Nocardioides sp. PD653]|nr:hypothetical protein PD653B2_1082 [Nocardioides sp. PD653-B2]GAW54404.1 hypothetical protein PD653_1812 [Nocardioides sp. PD653]
MTFVIVVAGLVAWLASGTASARSRRRCEERRRRSVHRDPRTANLLDVERRLREGLTDRQVDFVLARIERDGIAARTLWAWLDRFGAPALVAALASGRGYGELVRLLDSAAQPDLDEMSVLAGLAMPELFEGRDARADL